MANMLTLMDVMPTAADRINVLQAAEQMKAYRQQQAMQQDYQNAMVTQPWKNVQYTTETTPNAAYMTSNEISGVVDSEARSNALARMAQSNGSPADYQNYISEERNKLLSGVSPEMQQPTTTRQEAIPYQPKSYGEMMAMQQQAATAMQQYTPILNQALTMENGNTVAHAVADSMISSGNPVLMRSGGLIKKSDFSNPGEVAITGRDLKTMSPQELQGIGVTPQMAENAGERDVYTVKGRIGAMHVAKIVPHEEKTGPQEKDVTTSVPATTAALEEILSDPNATDQVKKDVKQWMNIVRKPGERKIDITKTVRDGKIVGFKAAFEPAAQKINIGVQGMDRRAGELPPGYFYETKGPNAGRIYSKDLSGNKSYLDKNEARQIAKDWVQEKGEAKQRSGVKAANIDAAYKMYTTAMPELLDLSKKIRSRGILPANLTSINAVNDWVNSHTSDPDVARFQTQLTFMADALSSAIGPGQGGKWTFDMASKLLNKNWNYPAFKRVVEGHKKELETMRKARRSFGKESAENKPSLTAYKQYWMKNSSDPRIKKRSDAEWASAYNAQYGGQ